MEMDDLPLKMSGLSPATKSYIGWLTEWEHSVQGPRSSLRCHSIRGFLWQQYPSVCYLVFRSPASQPASHNGSQAGWKFTWPWLSASVCRSVLSARVCESVCVCVHVTGARKTLASHRFHFLHRGAQICLPLGKQSLGTNV